MEKAIPRGERHPRHLFPSNAAPSGSGSAGVCMMKSAWRNGQDESFIYFVSSFLSSNSFRLNFVSIDPDLIFNCGGLSVAFVFITTWDCNLIPDMFSRIQKLKEEFAHFYVVVTLQTKEQNDSFVHSYFKFGMELGRPTFVPVPDVEMGFEKIVKIALSLGVGKQQHAVWKLKAERMRSMQRMDLFFDIVTSIPGIDSHDANSSLPKESETDLYENDVYQKLNQAIGSIEAIAKASKEDILEKTDLSAEKADTIRRFFSDPKFYLSPKLS